MKTETFPDGSTIDTDEATGNRTVVGKLAHDEYFRRLEDEKIFNHTERAIVAACRNVDGTRKAELIRTIMNPLLVSTFGPYGYEVWDAEDPAVVVQYSNYKDAKKAFDAICLHGTNGFGV
jgi:hypothetical protein